MTDASWSNAEVVRTLQRIEEGQTALAKKFDRLGETFVSRAEHDAVVARLDSELATLKSSRPQWTAVAAVVIAVVSVLLTAVQLIPPAA